MENKKINIDAIEELTDKMDFLENFLREDIPRVENILNEIKKSPLFEENFKDLKNKLNESVNEINEINEELKKSIEPVKKYEEILKGIKIKINSSVKEDIEKGIKSILTDFNTKEKESLNVLLNDIQNIVKKNRNSVEKMKDFVSEINFAEKSRIYYIIVFIFGIIIGVLMMKLTKG